MNNNEINVYQPLCVLCKRTPRETLNLVCSHNLCLPCGKEIQILDKNSLIQNKYFLTCPSCKKQTATYNINNLLMRNQKSLTPQKTAASCFATPEKQQLTEQSNEVLSSEDLHYQYSAIQNSQLYDTSKQITQFNQTTDAPNRSQEISNAMPKQPPQSRFLEELSCFNQTGEFGQQRKNSKASNQNTPLNKSQKQNFTGQQFQNSTPQNSFNPFNSSFAQKKDSMDTASNFKVFVNHTRNASTSCHGQNNLVGQKMAQFQKEKNNSYHHSHTNSLLGNQTQQVDLSYLEYKENIQQPPIQAQESKSFRQVNIQEEMARIVRQPLQQVQGHGLQGSHNKSFIKNPATNGQHTPDDLSRQKCLTHGKVLTLFCNNDKEFLCFDCIQDKKHRNHFIISVQIAQAQLKKQTSSLKQEAGEKLEKIEESYQDYTKKKQEAEHFFGESSRQIETEFNYIREQLQKKQQEVQNQLQKYYDKKIQAYNQKLQEIVHVRQLLQNFIQNYDQNSVNLQIQNCQEYSQITYCFSLLKQTIQALDTKGQKINTLEQIFYIDEQKKFLFANYLNQIFQMDEEDRNTRSSNPNSTNQTPLTSSRINQSRSSAKTPISRKNSGIEKPAPQIKQEQIAVSYAYQIQSLYQKQNEKQRTRYQNSLISNKNFN